MMLTSIGWILVHSLWQTTVLAGATALVLGLLRNRRAQSRYVASCIGLGAMVVAMLATGFARAAPMGGRLRRDVMPAVDGVVDLPTLIYWASIVVPIAGALWIAAVAMSSLRVASEFHRVRVLRRGAGEATPLAGDVDVRCSERVSVPMVIGWLRPLVLLPKRSLATLSDLQVRAILAHELAHVRRRDYAVNILAVVAESVLVFHPGARWVANRIRLEREFCCDDEAVAVAGDAVSYARALAALEDARSNCRLAVAASSGTLLDRIDRIVHRTRPTLTLARGVLALAVTSLVAAVLVTTALAVPPGLPWAAVMKRRMPPPAGALLGAERLDGVDAGRALRRKISGEERNAR